MYIVEQFYKKILKKEPPYYAKYSIWLIFWKLILKFISVVLMRNILIPNLKVYCLNDIDGILLVMGKINHMLIYKYERYLRMRCSGKKGIFIGENDIICADSLINKNTPDNKTAIR
jgi:hypothetical protein